MKKKELIFLWGLARHFAKQGRESRAESRKGSLIPNDPLIHWHRGMADGFKLATSALKMNLRLLKIGW